MNIEMSNLRPLKIGEILDGAFRLYRKNFWFFIGITGVLLVPFLILEMVSNFIFQNTSIISFIETLFINYLLNGAMIWAASQTYFGNTPSIIEAYREARQYIRPFLAANLWQVLAYVPVMSVLAIMIVFLTGPVFGGNNGGVIFLLLLISPMLIFLSTRWGVALPAIMLENLGGGDGLRRSWGLTSGYFKHSTVTLIASWLLTFSVVALPTILVSYLSVYFHVLISNAPILANILEKLGQIIAVPLSFSVLVILYYDLRVRREGYDLELAVQPHAEDDELDERV